VANINANTLQLSFQSVSMLKRECQYVQYCLRPARLLLRFLLLLLFTGCYVYTTVILAQIFHLPGIHTKKIHKFL